MKLDSHFERWLSRPMPGARGLHQDIFTAAAYLLEDGWTEADTFSLLRHACDLVQDRTVPDREINGAVSWARRKLSGEIELNSHSWPDRDNAWRAEVCKLYAADLEQLKAGALSHSPLEMLHLLYRSTDLVCIGKTAFEFVTVPVEDIPPHNRDLVDCEFINPSPMAMRAGLTADRKYSAHSKANTGPRVYLVIEFDDGHPSEHAAILKYLSKFLPLLMIVYSGKTSLHGWFPCAHLTEEQVVSFYAQAIKLGADPKMFSPCQFSRLPQGRNGKTARRQRVLFFNPNLVYHHGNT